MNKTEFLNAIKGRPSPFTTPLGTTVQLRPITVPERLALFAWMDEHRDKPGSAHALMERYVSLGVCNADGDSLFTPEEVPALQMPVVDFEAIGKEVARRAGLGGEDEGKPSPATPS